MRRKSQNRILLFLLFLYLLACRKRTVASKNESYAPCIYGFHFTKTQYLPSDTTVLFPIKRRNTHHQATSLSLISGILSFVNTGLLIPLRF
jgi:hypothetical protein